MPDKPRAVFVSYSRSDKEFAFRVAEDLKSAGAGVWLDQRDISAGERWDRAVESALLSCDSIVVILSPDAVGSSNVLDEVSFAIEHEKQIVPILYRDCTIPLRLRRIQYQDFRNEYAEGLSRLVRTLGLQESETGSITSPDAEFGSDVKKKKKSGSNRPPGVASATRMRVVLGSCGILAVALAILFLNLRNRPPSNEEISGEWHSEVFTDPNDPQSRPQQYLFTLKAVGDRLFGSVRLAEPPRSPGAAHGFGNGRIDGNKLSFDFLGGWYQQDGRGGQRNLKESFVGVYSDAVINFTYQREESSLIEFKAKKVGATNTQ